MVASEQWEMTPAQIADEYGLPVKQVEEALAFARAHRQEIESHLLVDARLGKEAQD